MNYIKIDPLDYPIKIDESWWFKNPNDAEYEFKVPVGSVSLCMENFQSFRRGIVYSITRNDSDTGWITLASVEDIVEMPYYVFKRYFDAEAFVRLRAQRKEKSIFPKKPFKYQDND